MILDVDLTPEETSAVLLLAERAGCRPEKVLHWALGSYLQLAPRTPADSQPASSRPAA